MQTQTKRIAIMGAGSIGTILGAMLTKGGVHVDLIDSYKAHVDALNEKGATVTGSIELNVPVSAMTPDQMTGIYDIVFLLCKQTGTKEAVLQLLPHLNENSTVCTLQNGLPEYRLAELIGRQRVVGGIVVFAATWEAPGVSRSTSDAKYLMTNRILEVGEIDGSITPRILEIRDILSHMGRVEVTENLIATRWYKVCVNSTQSGISAVVGDRFGVAWERDDAMFALAHVADEAARVVMASGVKQLPFFDKMILKDGLTVRESAEYFRKAYANGLEMKASMLQDLEKGRPCEIDFINGEICAAGRKLGIPTPYNDMLVAVVKAAQARKTVWNADEGMSFFRPLLEQSGDL